MSGGCWWEVRPVWFGLWRWEVGCTGSRFRGSGFRWTEEEATLAAFRRLYRHRARQAAYEAKAARTKRVEQP